MVSLMLMGMLLSSTYSRADGPIYDKDSMPALPDGANATQPAPVPARISSGTATAWEKIVTDPDEGGVNVQDGYVKGDSDNLYFRMTSYNPFFSTGYFYSLIWVDSDCNSSTGQAINDIGADYWVIVYDERWGEIYSWNGGWWNYATSVSYLSSPGDNTIETGVSWSSIGGHSDKQVVLGMIDGSTWFWDYAPDSGHANITTAHDLSVEPDEISFSGPVTASSDISITAEVHNKNPYFAENDIQVRFYMDRTSHIYHTVTIDSIPANGSATITVPWHVPSQEGSHTVKVVVDPDNLINETGESNNMAETQVTVLSASQTTTTSAGSTSVMGDATTLGLFGITMLLLVVFAVLIVTRRLRNR